MGGMTISPDMSDSSDAVVGVAMTVSPLTPITPGHCASGHIFPNNDYGEMSTASSDYSLAQPGQAQLHGTPHQGQYSSMPNKHYAQHQYSSGQAYPPGDFAQGYHAQDEQHATQWQ